MLKNHLPESERDVGGRESVPFRVRSADGEDLELRYSSPRVAAEHDEQAVLDELPWFGPMLG